MTSLADRLAVCSWSLQPKTPAELIEALIRIELNKMQLALVPLVRDVPWADGHYRIADAGLEVVGGMIECVGEDYSTLETIKKTGGVVPDETWPQTWSHIEKVVPIAADMGLDYVMFHAGFLPHEPSDPNFEKLLQRVRQVADAFGAVGIRLGLETGQEEADTLLAFFKHLDRSNVGINFDPANMILYNKDEPIDALKKLAPHVIQCHIKDAKRTKVEGEWGAEVVVGAGEVDWEAFFKVLAGAGFDGFMAIEREWGDQRIADIRTARDYVLKVAG